MAHAVAAEAELQLRRYSDMLRDPTFAGVVLDETVARADAAAAKALGTRKGVVPLSERNRAVRNGVLLTAGKLNLGGIVTADKIDAIIAKRDAEQAAQAPQAAATARPSRLGSAAHQARAVPEAAAEPAAAEHPQLKFVPFDPDIPHEVVKKAVRCVESASNNKVNVEVPSGHLAIVHGTVVRRAAAAAEPAAAAAEPAAAAAEPAAAAAEPAAARGVAMRADQAVLEARMALIYKELLGVRQDHARAQQELGRLRQVVSCMAHHAFEQGRRMASFAARQSAEQGEVKTLLAQIIIQTAGGAAPAAAPPPPLPATAAPAAAPPPPLPAPLSATAPASAAAATQPPGSSAGPSSSTPVGADLVKLTKHIGAYQSVCELYKALAQGRSEAFRDGGGALRWRQVVPPIRDMIDNNSIRGKTKSRYTVISSYFRGLTALVNEHPGLLPSSRPPGGWTEALVGLELERWRAEDDVTIQQYFVEPRLAPLWTYANPSYPRLDGAGFGARVDDDTAQQAEGAGEGDTEVERKLKRQRGRYEKARARDKLMEDKLKELRGEVDRA
jgi:hypothetical protein